MHNTLSVQPLTAATFAPFGTVIEVPHGAAGRPINGGGDWIVTRPASGGAPSGCPHR